MAQGNAKLTKGPKKEAPGSLPKYTKKGAHSIQPKKSAAQKIAKMKKNIEGGFRRKAEEHLLAHSGMSASQFKILKSTAVAVGAGSGKSGKKPAGAPKKSTPSKKK
eukprot:Colp12_sorted_trinity150504_noHs@35644